MPEASLRHHRSYLLLLPPLKLLLRGLMLLLGPLRVQYPGRVPKRGGVLVVANHISDLDPVAVQLACRRPIHFMAMSELFAMPLIGPIIRWCGAFPVERRAADSSAIKRAVALLRSGEVVCVFPEGGLSPNGDLQPLLPGAGLVARMASAQVIACRVVGFDRVIPYKKLWPRPSFHRTEVRWDEPRLFSRSDSHQLVMEWAAKRLASLADP